MRSDPNATSPAAGMAEFIATIRNSPSCAAVRHREIADELERLAAEVAELKGREVPVSATTQALIDQLRQRDAAGRAKYGTTLDRTDLSHADWLQHMAEELLDAAGYAFAAKRLVAEPQDAEGGENG